MISSISVVTHVYNQNKELTRFLRGLKKAGFTDELVVVVIGGEDPFELFNPTDPFSVKVFYMEKRSKVLPFGQAKNIGSSMAQGDTLVFLDVCQIPSKELVPAFMAGLNQNPEDIQMGRVSRLTKSPHKNWTYKYLNRHCAQPPLPRADHLRPLERELFKGSNFALKKRVFQELNGFDENYKGESVDMDFYYKAAEKGVKVFYNHFALAYEVKKSTSASSRLKEDLDSFIDNSSIFFSKWGHFPSKETLRSFQRRGLLKLDEKLGIIERAN